MISLTFPSNSLVLIAAMLALAQGQFPRVCITLDSLKAKECCPIPKGFNAPCGSDGNRGACQELEIRDWTLKYSHYQRFHDKDERRDWPHALYNKTGDEDFALPYWDWTANTECDPTICSEDLLGVTIQDDGMVKGRYFRDWHVICTRDQTNGLTIMCNPCITRCTSSQAGRWEMYLQRPTIRYSLYITLLLISSGLLLCRNDTSSHT